MLSIEFGSRLEKKEASAIAPSITNRGEDVPKLPRPRILIDGVDPGRDIIVTPGTCPCTDANTSVFTRSFNSSAPTEDTAPVKFTFF